MQDRRRGRTPLIRSLIGTALALALSHGPSYGLHPQLELDALSDGQIDTLLQAELDDEDLQACGLGNPTAPKPTEEMLDIILCALGDDNDDGDEDDLDDDDLEAEMEEANTTLEAQVRAALERADDIASGQPSPDAALRLVAAASDPPAAGPTLPDDERHALRDGRINPGKAAIVPVKLAIRAAIRAAR